MQIGDGQAAVDQFRDLLDDLPAICLIIDAHGSIAAANRFGAAYLGYAVEELQGMPILDLVTAADRDPLRRELEACAATPGQPFRWELRKLRRDGSEIWVRETARAVRQAEGEMVTLIVCDDITDTKRVQEELRESEQRYRLLVDMVPQLIWTTDASGFHTYFSRRWYDYTGAAPEDTRGHGWFDLLHPDDRERTLERWRRSLESGEPYDIEYRFRDSTGEFHWFLGRALPQRAESGDIVGWFGTLTDIEEQKRTAQVRERLLAVERESLEQVTAILESIGDAFIALDHEWRFTYLNQRAGELIEAASGRATGDLIGRTLPDALPEVWASEFGGVHRRAMEERRTVHHEAYLAAWDRWFAVRDYPSGSGLSIYFQDITERKLAEQERELLLERAQAARAAAESWAAEEMALREAVAAVSASVTTAEVLRQIASSAVAATGSDGAMVAWVDAERREVRAVAEAGRFPPHPDTFPYPGSYSQRVIEDGSPHLIRSLRDADGPIWARNPAPDFEDWSMLVLPLGVGGEAIGALFLARDGRRDLFTAEEVVRAGTFGGLATVAFRKLALLEESQDRRQELERITDSRTHLMRGFSHDLKNPLGAADGHAQLLLEGILGELMPKQRSSVERIRRSIHASLHLIDDLLELARAEEGQIDLDCGPVEVGEVVREAAEDFRAQATAEGLALEVNAPDGLTALADPARVRQILSNLLSNALKYTPEGGVTVSVESFPEGTGLRGGRWIGVSVEDTGPGVPAEKQEQIFQEFTRLDPEASPGAGVGLAISRRIARILAGDITLRSYPGNGSRFTLWLPAMPVED